MSISTEESNAFAWLTLSFFGEHSNFCIDTVNNYSFCLFFFFFLRSVGWFLSTQISLFSKMMVRYVLIKTFVYMYMYIYIFIQSVDADMWNTQKNKFESRSNSAFFFLPKSFTYHAFVCYVVIDENLISVNIHMCKCM